MRLVWSALGYCVLGVFLAACASTEKFFGPVDTSSAQQAEDSLTEAAKSLESTNVTAPPPEVTSALIPTLALALDSYQEERFDISVNAVAADEFFRGLVQGTPYNMVVHPGVSGEVSLNLKNVSLQQVLDITRQMYGYQYEFENGIYRVLPTGVRTEIFQINYLDIKRSGTSDIVISSGQLSAKVSGDGEDSGDSQESAVISRITTETESDFWTDIQETLETIVGKGEGQTVITNSSTGIVLVKALPDEIRDVKDYLQRSRLIMERQVVLEAKILEVTLNEGFQQGIDWQYLNDISSDVDENGNPLEFIQLGQGSDALSSTINGIFSATLQISNFTGFIEFLGNQGSVQVLSSPRIATMNNQKAVIKVGTDEFFVTGIEITNEEDSDSSSDIEITPFFSGIALDVTPQIGEDGVITLHVHPTISQVQDQTKTIVVQDKQIILPLALSTVRETDSVVKARDGQVVVIGGLIRNITRDNETSVPLLGDIPYFGEFFKQKRQVEEKSELVILIRPTLADQDTFRQDILNTRDRIKRMRTFIENDYLE